MCFKELLLLCFLFFAGCGQKPDAERNSLKSHNGTGAASELILDKEGLVLGFAFAKGDPQGIQKAFEHASLLVKEKYEPILNNVLSALGLKNIKLKNMHLLSKPSWVVSGTDIPSNYRTEVFQTVDLVADLERWHGDGYARSGPQEIFARKLVWPNVSKDSITQLSSQYNDLVFPSDSQSLGGPATWSIKISYRDLVSSFVRANALLLFNDSKADALYHQFSDSGKPCAGLEPILKDFVAQHFNALGAVSNLTCVVRKKEVPLWPNIDNNKTRTKEFTELKFKAGEQFFAITSTLRDKGGLDGTTFPKLVTELMLALYDKTFGSAR